MKSNEIDKLLAQQSAELLGQMEQGDPAARERLTRFLLESRRHVGSYLKMVAIDREIPSLDPEHKWDIAPRPDGKTANVVPLSAEPSGPSAGASASDKGPGRRRLWSIAAAILGGVMALASIYALLGRDRGWHDYTTAVGEQRAIELADGSVIHLNTQSHLEVRLSAHGRDVRLLAGEALFRVHHDTTRPFQVHTDAAVITAVGTEFNVYRRAQGDTQVAVLEGRVQVESEPEAPSGSAAVSDQALEHSAAAEPRRKRSASLSAGEKARIDRDGEIATAQTKDVASVGAWRQRRLIFKGTPLSEIVDEFNRYNRAPRFTLEGTETAQKRFSGIFDADDPESLMAVLKGEPDLHLERNGDEIIIRETESGGFGSALTESPQSP